MRSARFASALPTSTRRTGCHATTYTVAVLAWMWFKVQEITLSILTGVGNQSGPQLLVLGQSDYRRRPGAWLPHSLS
jgi:hypothetical protein